MGDATVRWTSGERLRIQPSGQSGPTCQLQTLYSTTVRFGRSGRPRACGRSAGFAPDRPIVHCAEVGHSAPHRRRKETKTTVRRPTVGAEHGMSRLGELALNRLRLQPRKRRHGLLQGWRLMAQTAHCSELAQYGVRANKSVAKNQVGNRSLRSGCTDMEPRGEIRCINPRPAFSPGGNR